MGVLLIFIPAKEYKQSEIKPISKERSCAITALYGEARGVSTQEKEAILDVVINRTRHKNFPCTICEVVHQPKQFSYFNTNPEVNLEFKNMNLLDKKAYLEIEQIVDNRLGNGMIKPNKVLPNSALFYHTKDVRPVWSTNKKIKQIGVDKSYKHVYYSYSR